MRKPKKKNGDRGKFPPRSYRFSNKTRALLKKIEKRTEQEQNDVVRKALEIYEKTLDFDKNWMEQDVMGKQTVVVPGKVAERDGKNLYPNPFNE